MHLIWFLLIGLVAGAVARLLVPGRDPMGWVGTIALGCVGSFVAGLLAKALFNDNNGVGLIGSILGAVVVLMIWNATMGRKGRGRGAAY